MVFFTQLMKPRPVLAVLLSISFGSVVVAVDPRDKDEALETSSENSRMPSPLGREETFNESAHEPLQKRELSEYEHACLLVKQQAWGLLRQQGLEIFPELDTSQTLSVCQFGLYDWVVKHHNRMEPKSFDMMFERLSLMGRFCMKDWGLPYKETLNQMETHDFAATIKTLHRLIVDNFELYNRYKYRADELGASEVLKRLRMVDQYVDCFHTHPVQHTSEIKAEFYSQGERAVIAEGLLDGTAEQIETIGQNAAALCPRDLKTEYYGRLFRYLFQKDINGILLAASGKDEEYKAHVQTVKEEQLDDKRWDDYYDQY